MGDIKKIFLTLSVIVTVCGLASFNKESRVLPAETYIVTTLAGSSDNGTSKDGIGKEAAFGAAVGRSTTDAEGNVYVLDNRCLRKITADGNVKTLLGERVYSADGQMITLSPLGFADGICSDPSGNIFISSGNTHVIKKIVHEQTLQHYAGTEGYHGTDDGPVTKAEFYNPQGICTDKAGNMYVADAYNYKVRKISADGKNVTTLAGKGEVDAFNAGTGKTAGFREFRCIVVDSKGNVYITQDNDPTGSAIIRITPARAVSLFAGALNRVPGAGKDGTGKAADFLRINALAIDNDDNIYIGENCRVRKMTPAGVVTTIAGSNEPKYRDAEGSKARFTMINGLSTDNKGNVYVSDLYCVRKIARLN